MSEGKWNHPMFEKIRNAEVEAPEFIMDAAIKRSNRNSFFYFQWHSMNVWYLALGLSIGLSLLFFNTKQNVNEGQLISKVQKEQSKPKVVMNRVSTIEVKESPSNIPSLSTKTTSEKRPIGENCNLGKNNSSVQSNPLMNTNTNSTNAVLSVDYEMKEVVEESHTDSLLHFVDPGNSNKQDLQTVQPRIDLPKKGRSLKVKIGENDKP